VTGARGVRRIEQPTRIRLGRMIGSALRQSEEALTAKVSSAWTIR